MVLRVSGLIARLEELRSELGDEALVLLGERGCELATHVDTVTLADPEDIQRIQILVRICDE